jgi:hypothetical protein
MFGRLRDGQHCMIGEMKSPLKYLLEIYQRHVAPQAVVQSFH